MKLSVVIPVWNERPTIGEIVRRVRSLPIETEIVVVDDGSTDGSLEILEALEGEGALRLIRGEGRLGKGAAVRRGFEAATGDAVVVQDADLEYDPADLPTLLALIEADQADVVYGSRFLGTPRRVLNYRHQLANRAFTLLSNLTTDLNLTDVTTCYKMMSREVVDSLKLRTDGFEIEAEITAKIARMGWRVFELPVAYYGRTYWEGKKLERRDGWRLLRTILRYAFVDDEENERAGYQILRRMQKLRRYNAWMWEQFSGAVGRRVLEVGSGIGNMTRYLGDCDRVIATDLDPKYLKLLENQFATYPHVTVEPFDLNDTTIPGGGDAIDTVICLNVLEHVLDHEGALRRIYDVLEPGGRLVLLVPAMPALYGSLDKALDHHRRYDRDELLAMLAAAGFTVEHHHFFNLLGVAGWYLNSRILGRKHFPPVQLSVYDSLVPLFRLESKLKLPFGMSLIAIARKPEA